MLMCCAVSSVAAPETLEGVARACSPRIERHGDRAVMFDASGLARAIGTPRRIAEEVERLAVAHGLEVRIALAGTTTAAWLLAHARPGLTIIEPGDEARAVGALPIGSLKTLEGFINQASGARPQAPARDARAEPGPHAQCLVPDTLSILIRWGLKTLGDFARLPRADVRARLGVLGALWHQAACGETLVPLVPAKIAARFVERLELEYAIDGLEPLSFVLARLCEPIATSLERADRGAVEIALRLRLVTRAVHERTLHLPAPMRDARVLRTLLLLDLESHPPPAAIDWVEVEVGVVPGAIGQGSLLTRALPSSEAIATLLARLRALVGESRVDAPALVDTYDDRRVAMAEFRVGKESRTALEPPGTHVEPRGTRVGFRRFRLPVVARVALEHGAPVRVDPAARGLAGGRVFACAGPWRSSGRWWALDRKDWDRDEWDVELADGGVYRLTKDRATSRWAIEGIVD
jgi:nucleotidyltransferase/DNA polymerase involved in DNA repair